MSRWLSLAVAAIAGGLLAAPAEGAMSYSASGPSTLQFPGVQTVSASLVFENTGVAPETVEVAASAPEMQFPRVGRTMDPQGYPVLENLAGVSTITSMRSSSGSYPASACLALVPDNTVGVYGDPSYGLALSVPPGARGVLAQRFRVGDFPARPGDSFAVQFFVQDSGGTRTVSAPEPQRLGPSGIQFSLTASAKRKKLFVSGSTTPALEAQVVSLRMASAGSTSPPVSRDLGSVRTDSQGRFHLKGKLPKSAGTYSFFASHTSANPSIASDTSCGVATLLPARPKVKRKKTKKETERR